MTVRTFLPRSPRVTAVQLGWDTWNEVCELAAVGRIEDRRPQGCYIDRDTGLGVNEFPGGNAIIGLWIPTDEGVDLAVQDDYIIAHPDGTITKMDPRDFADAYEEDT